MGRYLYLTVQQEHPSQVEQEQEEQAQFPCMIAVSGWSVCLEVEIFVYIFLNKWSLEGLTERERGKERTKADEALLFIHDTLDANH